MANEVTTSEQTQSPESGESARGVPIFRPRTDIVEAQGGVTLMLEMPGVRPDDVDISLERRILTIRGRAQSFRPEEYRLTYAEYDEGDFERAFTLSEDLDPERIEAELRNGVLTLTLPRAEAAKPKRISVKGA